MDENNNNNNNENIKKDTEEKKSFKVGNPVKKLKAAAAEKPDPAAAIDKKLAKEEAATLEANRIAASDPELRGKSRLQVKAGEICMALLAAAIGSFATVSIMLPNGLTFGGITGISRIVQHYTGWNYSVIYYCMSFLVIAIVWAGLGLKEVRKIILMSLAYPTFMMLFELTHLEYTTDDKFLAALFCGVIMGVANGLTFKAGFSSGGTDSIAKVVKYKRIPHKSINDITFAINTVIVILSAFVFGVDIALYAILTIYMSMRIGEAVMYGLSTQLVELDIIPSDPESLTKYIMEELGRGVSSVEVTGEYTGDTRKQLKIICSPRESFLIKRHLANNDPQSFVAVYNVNSVEEDSQISEVWSNEYFLTVSSRIMPEIRFTVRELSMR